jgi:predicted nucleic acid-binding protein
VTEAVLDASVILKWFRPGEAGHKAARALRDEYEAGDLGLFAPTLLPLEIINVAGRKWGWEAEKLADLASSVIDLGIAFVEPDLDEVARWTAEGLTAYDAAYVTVADGLGIKLVTDDAGPPHRSPLAATWTIEASTSHSTGARSSV